MDDVKLNSFFLPSSWKKETTYSNSSTFTEPVKKKDVGCDPMQQKSVDIQTDAIVSKSVDENVKIDEKVITNIENMLKENIRLSTLFNQLNIFHKADRLRLEVLRTYNIQMLEAEEHTVIGMVCGTAGRVAILVGELYHSSWCGHQAKVVVSQRNQVTSFPQPVCPTCAAWSPHSLLAVGSISGEISVYSSEKQIASNSEQTRPLTSITWYSTTRLISCNTDGQITMWVFKGTELELEQSITLSVSNLPRRIRKSSPSNKPLAIVGMQRHKNELYVASETGGLWMITVPDFQIKTIPSEPRAVQFISYCAPHIAVADDFSSVTILGQDGSLINTIGIVAKWLYNCSNMLVVSDGSRVVFYDCYEQKVLSDEKLAFIALAPTTTYSEMVVLTRNYELVIYNIVRD